MNMTPKLNNTIDSSSSLLVKLINRGDEVSIVKGKLIMQPNSGLPVPVCWLKQNRTLLINDICNLFNCIPLQYISYTTGNYGQNKSPGVTLQFIDLLSRKNAYIIFNANLKRSRKSKYGKKGDPLPNKQFIVGERSSFYKFWLSTGLALPKSLSKFYECMGKLKQLTFTGEIDSKDRIKDKKLTLLEVTYHEILNKLKKPKNAQVTESLTAKQSLTFHQKTANQPLILTAKSISPEPTSKGLATNKSTCISNHGNKYIRKEVIEEFTNADISTLDSYKYNRTETPNNKPLIKNKQPEVQTVDEWLEDWEAAFTSEEFKEVMTEFNKNSRH
ncbi:hypothetical protein GCM10025767_16660 [Thalassotalea piscium]